MLRPCGFSIKIAPTGSWPSCCGQTLQCFGHSFILVAQLVKNQLAVWETWVQSLGWEDPLEKEMATHSSTLYLENSMDGGVWWAIVPGVAKSRTQLSDFTSLCLLWPWGS